MADGTPEQKRARIEARRLAEELEATGLGLDDPLGADMVRRAAELHRDRLDDWASAAAVARKGLKRHPDHLGLLNLAIELAEGRSDLAELAELYGAAAKAASGSELRAAFVAKRGDVLGLGLSRLAEARGLYREVMRALAPAHKRAAEQALVAVEAALAAGQRKAEWSPVVPEPIRLELPADKEAEPDSIAAYQARLTRTPIDERVLAEAVRFAIRESVVAIASRLLPEQRPEQRVALLERVAEGAEGVGDAEAALELRVVALEDSPSARPYAPALAEAIGRNERPRLYARFLRALARHVDDFAEKKSLLKEAQRRAEGAGDPWGAAEAVLDRLRLPGLGEDLERLLAAADRLSLETHDRTLLTRALGAAATHQELSPDRRAQLLEELARILEHELGDPESARAVRSELYGLPRGPGQGERDTALDVPNPIAGMSFPSLSWAEEVESGNTSQVVEAMVARASIEVERAALAEEQAVSVRPRAQSSPRPRERSGPRKTPKPPDSPLLSIDQALCSAQLDQALGLLEGAPDQVSLVPLWLRTGQLALALSRPSEARRAFQRASELAADPEQRKTALEGWEKAASADGAAKESARARAEVVSSFEDKEDHPDGKPGRAKALARAGEAFSKARMREDARRFYERALSLEPSMPEAVAALIRMAGDDGDRPAIERLFSGVTLSALSPAQRGELWLARGLAELGLGDAAAGARALEQSLAADPLAIRAAEELLALGVAESKDSYVDSGLEALRARAVALGDATRAFLAAAARVARGGAPQEDRTSYEINRSCLLLSPRGALGEGWLAEWMGLFSSGDDETLAESEPGPELELEPAEKAALADAEAVFGLSGVTLHAAPGDRVLLFRTRPTVAVGVPTRLRGRVRRLRFDLGRALAAATEPRLLLALASEAEPDRAPSVAQVVLDRAGLVVGGDPAVALEAVGAKTPRGLRLTAFSASRGLVELFERLGVRVQTRPPLTNRVSRS